MNYFELWRKRRPGAGNDTNADRHVWGQTGHPHFVIVEVDSENESRLTVKLIHGN